MASTRKVNRDVRRSQGRGNPKIMEEAALTPPLPFAHLAGKYNDEPLWDEFLEAIAEYRAEVNKRESPVE